MFLWCTLLAVSRLRWTFSCPPVCLFSGMSEVSLEAESGKTSADDPQLDCEVKESLSEDVEKTPVDNRSEVLYDVDIDSDEGYTETSDKDAQRQDERVQKEDVVSGSVDDGGHGTEHHADTAETPEKTRDSHTEAKVIFYLHFKRSAFFNASLPFSYVCC